MIKEFKKSVPWTYFVNDTNGEEVVRTFYEKELRKKLKKLEKLSRKKVINQMSNAKVMNIFNTWVDKK